MKYLFYTARRTLYLQLYDVGHVVKDHPDSERGNPLPPLRVLFFPISSDSNNNNNNNNSNGCDDDDDDNNNNNNNNNNNSNNNKKKKKKKKKKMKKMKKKKKKTTTKKKKKKMKTVLTRTRCVTEAGCSREENVGICQRLRSDRRQTVSGQIDAKKRLRPDRHPNVSGQIDVQTSQVR